MLFKKMPRNNVVGWDRSPDIMFAKGQYDKRASGPMKEPLINENYQQPVSLFQRYKNSPTKISNTTSTRQNFRR